MNDSKEKILLEIPSKIMSDRLIIRKYTSNDARDYLDLFKGNDNRNFLKEHIDDASDIHTIDEAIKRLEDLSNWFDSQTRFVMGIWIKENKQYIGSIWIEPKQWDVPSLEIGYYLDKGFTKKGYASEAVKRSMRFIIEDLKAHKIILITRDTNENSIRLAERMGFIKEGHFIESNIKNGKRFGLIFYRLLRSEYFKLLKNKK